jgi:16S rRNA processing protein RimM
MTLIDRDRLTCIGTVSQAHGVKGDLKVAPLTDTPAYYERSTTVILETKQGLRDFKVSGLRRAGNHWIMTLEGLKDRGGAEAYRGARVLLDDSLLRPLEPGEYFQHDLIGCEVETLTGDPLGRVKSIMETGANDVLVVGDGSLMVPMLAEVVKEVDVHGRRIRIAPLPGLLEAENE